MYKMGSLKSRKENHLNRTNLQRQPFSILRWAEGESHWQGKDTRMRGARKHLEKSRIYTLLHLKVVVLCDYS